jgi:hypothetical protein
MRVNSFTIGIEAWDYIICARTINLVRTTLLKEVF